jgi:Leucine-rich repeat (LRR) protein
MSNSTNRQLKVFLCHASSDKPRVQELYSRLTNDGIDAWLDKEKLIPGQKWQIEIPKAVRNSDVVIVCLSSLSVTKEGFVQKEIRFALDAADEKPEGTIFIIPARLENCDVPERIGQFHWVDLFTDDGYERLINALRVRARTLNLEIKPNLNTLDNKETISENRIEKEFESDNIVSFRGVRLPASEVNVLIELERGREKASFKPVAEIDTYNTGFIVEKEHVVGLGLGKWGYSWGNEKAQIVPESIGRLTALKTLDMSYADIDYIPETLGNLTALERLNLKDNRLAIVPDCICNLTNLIQLDLDSNSLTSLPECIGKLQNLKDLILEHNRIGMLPDSFGELRSLEHLDLWENREISSFPEAILKLQSLKELSINGNSLKTIPEAISNLKELSSLRLDMNDLIALPESIGNLRNLEVLTLGWNELGIIPESVGNLVKLRELDLWDAKLKAFPKCICRLVSLEELNLGNNKIGCVPEEMRNLKSLRTLKLYNNIITELPESIDELPQLKDLYLDSNKLKSLPKTLDNLESLEYLCLTDNPLLNDMDETTKGVLDKLSQKGVTIEVKKYGYK